MIGTPGTYAPGNPQPYPQMNQLKRIHVSSPNTTPINAISFMLPYRNPNSNIKYVTPLAGAIVGSYSNSFVPSIDLSLNNSKKQHFRTISKAWRASFSKCMQARLSLYVSLNSPHPKKQGSPQS